jgi:seryl-tRNA synthetase
MFGAWKRKKQTPTVEERLTQIDTYLRDVLKQLTYLGHQGRVLMAQNAELKAFLDQANTYTNEIAADVEAILARLNSGEPMSDEDKAALQAHVDTLKNIAAKYNDPLPAPVEPTV